jgi:2-keto-4-pentenoate hydratase/2-oxohepta-3-ene-1,7-dioic acid hydratase in catechol pathway
MKFICIGLNYLDHTKEFKSGVPEKPMFFLKPDTALLRNNNPFFIPDFTNEIHYEVELILKINRLGKSIQPQFSHRYFDEIGIGIDFTARDIQNKCREKGMPWEIAKAFDYSAAVGKFLPKSKFKDLNNIHFHLEINGKTVQQGCSANMVFKFDELISYTSMFMTFRTGDIMFTGTPSGVGPVKIGDRLQAYIEDELLLDFLIK